MNDVTRRVTSASQLRPNLAKRLECVELAPAFDSHPPNSADKPDALQTLRDLAATAHE
jgi:hypothetical protein